MKTLVVYDTQFGNTEKVAQVIGQALACAGEIRVVPLTEVDRVDLTGVDLLVIGGPTQAHRARKPLRDWVERLSQDGLGRLDVAVFDTRLSWPAFLSGSAAHSIAHIFQRHNKRLLVPTESFIMEESEGPIAEDELERAAKWAKLLAVRADIVPGAVSAAD
jgi:flavodoxin